MASQTVINNATVEKKTWILFADTNIIHTPRRKTTAFLSIHCWAFAHHAGEGTLSYIFGGEGGIWLITLANNRLLLSAMMLHVL